MGLMSRREAIPLPPPRTNSLVASAAQVRLTDQSWMPWRFRDEAWQRELWRLYDIVPEFHSAASWVGSGCSRVRIYVADVDELGRPQQESEDDNVQALSDVIFGGPAGKQEALRNLGINFTVAGEAYIVGASTKDSDRWWVLSSSEVRMRDGSMFYGDKNYMLRFNPDRDIVIRVWTPHPRRIWLADSPARACQPVLLELERLTKYVFSQIDSRLAGAGMLIIPNNLDFPAQDGVSSASESLMLRLAQGMAASLKGEGAAAALVPLILEANPEDIERAFKLLDFSSELSKQAVELREEAIRRLGMGMDMPPEALTGTGDTNHWSAWHIEESGVKIHIEPLMSRICDGLTSAYLAPALKVMGKDPARYTFWFDTSPLTVRPQRLTDALNLFNSNAIGVEALREAGYFKETDAPSEEEDRRKFIRELLLRDPVLFGAPGIREIAGFPEDVLPPDSATPPPPPPAPVQGIQSTLPDALPERTAETEGITAGAAPRLNAHDAAVLVAANAAVVRALEVAGSRLLARGSQRAQYPDVARHELHTKVRVLGVEHVNRLLDGAFANLGLLVATIDSTVDTQRLESTLRSYCADRLFTATPHIPGDLAYDLLRSHCLSRPPALGH